MDHRQPRARCRGSRGSASCWLLIAAVAAPGAAAGVIGQWDFSQGWNPTTGVLVSGSSVPGMTLVSLPKTPYYQDPAAHGYLPIPQDPPDLEFATTGSFGIANLGSGSSAVVMKDSPVNGTTATVFRPMSDS